MRLIAQEAAGRGQRPVFSHGWEIPPASSHSDILHQDNSWSPFPCGHLILLRFPFTGGTFVSVLSAPPAASVSPSGDTGRDLATAQLGSEAQMATWKWPQAGGIGCLLSTSEMTNTIGKFLSPM